MVLALLSRVLWLVAGDGSLDPASCLIRCLCEALTTAPSFGLRWVCYQAMFTPGPETGRGPASDVRLRTVGVLGLVSNSGFHPED